MRSFEETPDIPGMQDAYLLVNRTTGRVATITLWEDENRIGIHDASGARRTQRGHVTLEAVVVGFT